MPLMPSKKGAVGMLVARNFLTDFYSPIIALNSLAVRGGLSRSDGLWVGGSRTYR